MTLNVLSLSGGGFLGLYSVSVLAEIERELGRPISTCFDLIAGTSVGGIIALGLACDVPAADIQRAFEQNGSSIFSHRSAPRGALAVLDLLRSALKPKYDPHALRSTIAGIVGEDTRMADLRRRVVIPVVNLSTGRPQAFKTPHHENLWRDRKLRVVDVGMATAAAPTFFPIAQIDDALFADGGLYANCPDMMALHEATYFLGAAVDDVRLLSIGTTSSKFSFPHTLGRNLGVIQWATRQRLVNVMIAAQQASATYMLGHALGDRYLRIDVDQSPEQERDLALDVATEDAMATLRALAAASAQQYGRSPLIRKMLAEERAAHAYVKD